MLENLPEAVGEALGNVRAGLSKTLYQSVDLRQGMGKVRVASLAFADHAPIPERYTADGPGLSPPLHWTDVPSEAVEVVLIVEDADSPTPQPLVHAIAHALPTGDGALAEGALGGADLKPTVSTGLNSLLQGHWLVPDPPPGHGQHRYVFQIYALGPGPALAETPGRDALRQSVLLRGLASGCLIGTYERPSGDISVPEGQPVGPLSSA